MGDDVGGRSRETHGLGELQLLLGGEAGHLQGIGEGEGHHLTPAGRPSQHVGPEIRLGLGVQHDDLRYVGEELVVAEHDRLTLVPVDVAQGSVLFQRLLGFGQHPFDLVGQGLLLAPLEGSLDGHQVGQDELVVQVDQVGLGVGRLAEQGVVEGPEHVQEDLAAGQRVQVAVHLALASGGLRPDHFAHAELGEGGLLRLEDLGEGAHPVVAHPHRGDGTLGTPLGQGGQQGRFAGSLQPDDPCFHGRDLTTKVWGLRGRGPGGARGGGLSTSTRMATPRKRTGMLPMRSIDTSAGCWSPTTVLRGVKTRC